MKKKTLVIGASSNPSRYSYLAANRLVNAGHPIMLLGRRDGDKVADSTIQSKVDGIKDIHTVTLYLRASNQKEYESFLLKLKPKRVIFNPGAENASFMKQLIDLNIDAFEACTLVLLSTGQF